MNQDITTNAFLQNPPPSSISNLWRCCCFFQNTTQLMSCSFRNSSCCVQFRLLHRESSFKWAQGSSWIHGKVSKALARGRLFIYVSEVKSWFAYVLVWVCVSLCLDRFYKSRVSSQQKTLTMITSPIKRLLRKNNLRISLSHDMKNLLLQMPRCSFRLMEKRLKSVTFNEAIENNIEIFSTLGIG